MWSQLWHAAGIILADRSGKILAVLICFILELVSVFNLYFINASAACSQRFGNIVIAHPAWTNLYLTGLHETVICLKKLYEQWNCVQYCLRSVELWLTIVFLVICMCLEVWLKKYFETYTFFLGSTQRFFSPTTFQEEEEKNVAW